MLSPPRVHGGSSLIQGWVPGGWDPWGPPGLWLSQKLAETFAEGFYGEGERELPVPHAKAVFAKFSFVHCSRSHRKAFVHKTFSFPEAGKAAWMEIKQHFPQPPQSAGGAVSSEWLCLEQGWAVGPFQQGVLPCGPVSKQGTSLGQGWMGRRWWPNDGLDRDLPGQGEGVMVGSRQGCK